MGYTRIVDTYSEPRARTAHTVTKQVWNGNDFVEVTYHRCAIPTLEQRQWLIATFGPAGSWRAGQYWDYSNAGAYAMMDEKVFTWFRMRWAGE